MKAFTQHFHSVNGLLINGCIGANNKEAVGMLEQSRENITLVLSRSRNSTFATKVSNSLMLKSLPARDRPLSSIFENEIDTKSLLSGKDLKKTWMDYYENLARSCEHLNFPAHLSLMTCCWEKSRNFSKKFRLTTFSLLGRETKI